MRFAVHSMRRATVVLVAGAMLAGVLAAPALAGQTFTSSASNWKILTTVALPNGGANFATSHPDATSAGLSFALPDQSVGYAN
jgi:ABC-type oligopeptide transport system substrate-binding subunit